MTHDPLCPYQPRQPFICCTPQTILCQVAHTTPGISCQCELISKVRADALDDFLNRVMPETFNGQWKLGYEQGRLHEREQAALRVAQNVLVGMTLTGKEVRAVIAAVRGES